MKRVFRSHPILLYGGRFFCWLTIVSLIVFCVIGLVAVFNSNDEYPTGIMVVCCGIVWGLTVYYFKVCVPYLWVRCFEKLIISDECITWKCLFLKSRTIQLSDIRFQTIIALDKGNVIWLDLYGTGFKTIILSTDLQPIIRSSDKVRCTNSLIAFRWSIGLCKALAEAIPSPRNRLFENEVKRTDYIMQKISKNKKE